MTVFVTVCIEDRQDVPVIVVYHLSNIRIMVVLRQHLQQTKQKCSLGLAIPCEWRDAHTLLIIQTEAPTVSHSLAWIPPCNQIAGFIMCPPGLFMSSSAFAPI